MQTKVLFFFIMLGNSMLSFLIGNYIHLRFGVLPTYNLIPFFINILTRLRIITPQEFQNLEDLHQQFKIETDKLACKFKITEYEKQIIALSKKYNKMPKAKNTNSSGIEWLKSQKLNDIEHIKIINSNGQQTNQNTNRNLNELE